MFILYCLHILTHSTRPPVTQAFHFVGIYVNRNLPADGGIEIEAMAGSLLCNAASLLR